MGNIISTRKRGWPGGTRAFTTDRTEEQTKIHEENSKYHFISVKANNRSGVHPMNVYFAASQPQKAGTSPREWLAFVAGKGRKAKV